MVDDGCKCIFGTKFIFLLVTLVATYFGRNFILFYVFRLGWSQDVFTSVFTVCSVLGQSYMDTLIL